MKKLLWVVAFAALVMAGCEQGSSGTDTSSTSLSGSTSSTDSETTSLTSVTSSSSSDGSSQGTSASTLSTSSTSASETSTSSSSASTSLSSSSTSYPDQVTLDFYAINDFHGTVEETDSNYEPGISKLAALLDQKEAANPEGYVLLSAGDMWQGSADSNITHGSMVTEAMNAMHFEAMAIGNHEFDWTDEYIYANQALADFPFLAANIIDKRTDEVASFAQPYTMIEREGVKIGIIGVIGQNLESDILASAVANYDFVDPSLVVPAASEALKAEGADIVILLNHNPDVPSAVLPYVDAVFCGHDHVYNSEMIGSVPLVEGSYNGRGLSHVQFTFTKSTSALTLNDYGYEYTSDALTMTPDTAVSAILAKYADEINVIKNEVVGTASGSLSKTTLGMMATKAMLAYGEQADVQIAVHNSGGVRATISAGTVTYGDVYKVFPFDNNMIICEVTGAELLDYSWLSTSNYITYASGLSSKTINRATTYRVITIDYLALKLDATQSGYYGHDTTNDVNTYSYVRDLIKDRFLELGTVSSTNY